MIPSEYQSAAKHPGQNSALSFRTSDDPRLFIMETTARPNSLAPDRIPALGRGLSCFSRNSRLQVPNPTGIVVDCNRL